MIKPQAMYMSDTSSGSETQTLSEDDDSILIEVLEAQVDELTLENQRMKTKIKDLEETIKSFLSISQSDLVNKVFSYL